MRAPKLEVMDAFKIRNPDVPIALHSVFIADSEGKIYYRKVGRRRPLPKELLEAIDFHHGRWSSSAETVNEGDVTGYHIELGEALVQGLSQPEVPFALMQTKRKTEIW